MILEVAVLTVQPGKSSEFESQFRKAVRLVASTRGYISHELQKCVEVKDKYLLLVQWETIKAHSVGFRTSPVYEEWKALLMPFYEIPPVEEHYIRIRPIDDTSPLP
ncbi:antibiotic biosynthesis monooxygenase family protein [Paenibacillus pinihumi]|uniref:antibiotic biosynthesis monooxygenase family protein n=1 Tax=Paenibacillus pinihumi TaxID=669462 RepID=UPI00041081E6|nr:antibiotic biosynthesis monooxygenase [Paenibacillus pinihumi]